MAIQYLGTTISGLASDTKPTLSANEKGVIYIETDTNKIYQWDTDSWNELITTGNTSVGALNSGSITSGFGNIDTGSSTITTTGLITAGNLTVTGTTTTVNATNLLIEDPLLVLAKDQSGSPAWDAGFVIERGSSNNVALLWDESEDKFVFAYTNAEVGSTAGSVTINSYAHFAAKDIHVDGDLIVDETSTFTGNATFSGNVSLGDNDRIVIGTDSDFQIYHDGATNIIDGGGTADIKIQDSSHTSAIFDTSAEVQLWYDNSKKFETTAAGATVTGAFTATGPTTASSTNVGYFSGTIDNNTYLLVENLHTSASGSHAVVLAKQAQANGGDPKLMVQAPGATWAIGADNSAGDVFKISNHANLETNTRLTIDGNGNVGIGETTPAAMLHIKHATTSGLEIETTGADSNAIMTFDNDARWMKVGLFGDDSDSFKIVDSAGSGTDIFKVEPSGDVRFFNSGTSKVVWDASDNGLEFVDGANALFGTGGDMKIWHDSNTNKIDSTSQIQFTNSSSNTVATFVSGTADAYVHIRDADSATDYPPGLYADGDDLYLRAGGDANGWQKGIMLDDNGFVRLKGHTALGNNYLYDIGHANSEWIDTGIKIASATSSTWLSMGVPLPSSGSTTFEGGMRIYSSSGTDDRSWAMWADANNPRALRIEYSGARGTSFGSGTNVLTLDYQGNVGIGVNDPDAKLEVAGQVKITGGSPGADKVLTSDANGLATWESSSGVDLDGAITINDSGASVDFRVESNTNANMLVVDGSADGVAIGASNSNPNGHGAKLLVETSAGSPMVEFYSTNSDADGPRIMFTHNTTSMAEDDAIAALNFRANHDSSAGGDWIEYARIAPTMDDVANADGRCDIIFQTISYQSLITAKLAANGQWTNGSDAAIKTYEGTAHSIYGGTEGRVITDKLKTLNVGRFRYKNTPVGKENDKNTERHIGPTAQDFYSAFGTGTEKDSLGYEYTNSETGEQQRVIAQLAPGDVGGVSLMAIKELIKRIEDLEAEVLALKG